MIWIGKKSMGNRHKTVGRSAVVCEYAETLLPGVSDAGNPSREHHTADGRRPAAAQNLCRKGLSGADRSSRGDLAGKRTPHPGRL